MYISRHMKVLLYTVFKDHTTPTSSGTPSGCDPFGYAKR